MDEPKKDLIRPGAQAHGAFPFVGADHVGFDLMAPQLIAAVSWGLVGVAAESALNAWLQMWGLR